MFQVVGTGIYLPKNRIDNDYFIKKFGADPLQSVFERIGHGARYYADKNESSADLAVQAGREAILNAGISTSDIGLVIVATDTPSQLSPATSAEVQFRLEAKNAAAFDVNCACAGFVTAMDIAARYLGGDSSIRHAVVIGTYAMSKFLDPEDGVSTPLFGDGAGAVVLKADKNAKPYASTLKADGQYWDYMGIYAGGTKMPVTNEILNSPEKWHTVKIPKKFPSSLNRDEWPPLIRQTLAKINLDLSDAGFYIFTQIRKVTIEEVMAVFNLPMDRTHTIMEKWGYTGSACIPMALHDAIKQGKLAKGTRLVLCASGGGYSMACNTFCY